MPWKAVRVKALWNTVKIAALVVFVVLCGVGFIGAIPYMRDLAFQESATNENQATQQTKQTEEDFTVPLVVVGIFVFLIIVRSLSEAFHKSAFIFFVVVALFAGVLGVWYFGDKDGDGVGDIPQAQVIQPSGADAKIDGQYADINIVNAEANVTNIIGIVILLLTLVMVVFIVGIVAYISGHIGSA